VFGDQLLVRGPRGLTPTLRAQQLMDQLDQVIAVIEQLVALPTGFVPNTSRRTFTLIGTDFIETRFPRRFLRLSWNRCSKR